MKNLIEIAEEIFGVKAMPISLMEEKVLSKLPADVFAYTITKTSPNKVKVKILGRYE